MTQMRKFINQHVDVRIEPIHNNYYLEIIFIDKRDGNTISSISTFDEYMNYLNDTYRFLNNYFGKESKIYEDALYQDIYNKIHYTSDINVYYYTSKGICFLVKDIKKISNDLYELITDGYTISSISMEVEYEKLYSNIYYYPAQYKVKEEIQKYLQKISDLQKTNEIYFINTINNERRKIERISMEYDVKLKCYHVHITYPCKDEINRLGYYSHAFKDKERVKYFFENNIIIVNEKTLNEYEKEKN